MEKDDALTLISYLIAAALLAPVGWWLQSHRMFGFGDWVMSILYSL
jgi:hypothetical protein